MKSNESMRESVKVLIRHCIEKMRAKYQEEEITDFYIRIDPETNYVSVSDDGDEVLSYVTVPALDEADETAATDIKAVVGSLLHEELQKMSNSQVFDGINVFRPFSFVLDDGDMMEDLLVVDDENFIVGDSLLEGLEADLDSFLDDLLK